MEEIGFVDIVEKDFYWLTGKWAQGEYFKTVGDLYAKNMCNGIEGMSLKVLGALGWTPEEIREFLVLVRKDFVDVDVFCYAPL